MKSSGLPDGLVHPIEISNEHFFLPEYSAGEIPTEPVYSGILTVSNKWMDLACDLATRSAGNNGGPFGAVILQVDSASGQALRYWAASNGVTKQTDPTAHAEVLAIRSACYSLGNFHLDRIRKTETKLEQPGEFSHCILFSSCEPCPMCYGAVSWARIPVLFFGASRADAAGTMVNFLDADIYRELEKPYLHRKIKTFRCQGAKTTEAFTRWKENPGTHY